MTKARWFIFIVAMLFAFALTGGNWAIADDDPPSAEQEEFAEDVYTLMFNELVAALFQEFNETHPGNVEHGKLAISLIFNDRNRDMRLVGTSAPLLGGANNLPRDDFEERALRKALQGGQAHRAVERVNGRWYLRRSFALNNNFHSACVQCHTSFPPNKGNQWVGALMQRVPINTDDDGDDDD
jgi:hypothetical protein